MNEDLVKQAEEALQKAIENMNTAPYAHAGGAAAQVAAAAYALAVLRGDDTAPPQITATRIEQHKHGFFG